MKPSLLSVSGLLGLALTASTTDAYAASPVYSADAPRPHGGSARSRYESSQHFALELRFSPYRPQIDTEPGLTSKPYETTFGTMPRLLFGGEFDWQALRIPHFGTVGPGLGVGYTNMSETAKLLRDGTPSGDETSLDLWSFYTVAVLRVDVLWREFNIPFVPYAKAGLGLGLWQAGNTGGTAVAKVGQGTVEGKGYSFGTQLAVGMAFALDVLDRSASRSLDASVGINNTYVYGELYASTLNGIGQDHALRVGANSWTAGLAFEF